MPQSSARSADRQKLEFLNAPEDAVRWPSLSAGETLRLHRGLLRYELCCRLFGVPFLLRVTDIVKDSLDDSADEDGPYCIIKDLMQPWELQEIPAVRADVQRKYDILHLNVQNKFLVDIQSLDQKICS